MVRFVVRIRRLARRSKEDLPVGTLSCCHSSRPSQTIWTRSGATAKAQKPLNSRLDQANEHRELRTNERLRRANAPQHRAHKPHALMQLAFPQIAISVTRIERGISNRNARRLGRRVDAFAF